MEEISSRYHKIEIKFRKIFKKDYSYNFIKEMIKILLKQKGRKSYRKGRKGRKERKDRKDRKGRKL